MTLSTGPWWCAPVFALGWITTVPAQSFSAPARARVIAAARFMPGVCGVLMSSSFECTTRTPSSFHFGLAVLMRALSTGAGPQSQSSRASLCSVRLLRVAAADLAARQVHRHVALARGHLHRALVLGARGVVGLVDHCGASRAVHGHGDAVARLFQVGDLSVLHVAARGDFLLRVLVAADALGVAAHAGWHAGHVHLR